ncbi:hypothetical protein [Massilia sp. NP310]|uniref:hypothetical protein n=1 Tax=Massilia sp. NP310 TaxID=2861282 RepID=UPI001C631B07|nr:hypothetical protein [Massilia sp. NP310]QYG02234.1 hypothetical protein KY496_01955 [Massilia sp. NP310]
MDKVIQREACKPRGATVRVVRLVQHVSGIGGDYGGRVVLAERCEHEARGCPHLEQCPLREDE